MSLEDFVDRTVPSKGWVELHATLDRIVKRLRIGPDFSIEAPKPTREDELKGALRVTAFKHERSMGDRRTFAMDVYIAADVVEDSERFVVNILQRLVERVAGRPFAEVGTVAPVGAR